MTGDDHETIELVQEEPSVAPVVRGLQGLASDRVIELRQAYAHLPSRTSASRARRKFLLAAIAAGLIILAVAPAFGAVNAVRDLFTASTSQRPVPDWALPGTPVSSENQSVDPLLHRSATAAGIDPKTIREVAQAGTGSHMLTLLVGRGPDGAIWYARKSEGAITQFSPLSSHVQKDDAIVSFELVGGPPPQGDSYQVTWTTIVGFTRADVKQVAVVMASGQRRVLPINRWHGFGFASSTQATAPRTIQALDGSHNVLDRAKLDAAR